MSSYLLPIGTLVEPTPHYNGDEILRPLTRSITIALSYQIYNTEIGVYTFPAPIQGYDGFYFFQHDLVPVP